VGLPWDRGQLGMRDVHAVGRVRRRARHGASGLDRLRSDQVHDHVAARV